MVKFKSSKNLSFFFSFFNSKTALFASIFVYLIILVQTFFSSYFPGGVDASTHLFQIGLIAEEGFTPWNHWWYAGHPLLDQYPQLSHAFGAVFSNLIGVNFAYRIVELFAFILLPISFYLLLQEFSFNEKQKAIAILLFSFSPVFNYYLQGGVLSALFSIPFAILFLKYLIRVLSQRSVNFRDLLLSAIFLAIVAVSHLFTPVAAVVFGFIYLISFSLTLSSFKRFIAIIFVSGALVSFFWIPLVLNYSVRGEPLSVNSLSSALSLAISPFGRAFAVYVNFVSIVAILLLSVAVIYSFIKDFSSRKTQFSLMLLFAILMVFLWVLFFPHSSQAGGKLPLFLPISFSLFLCRYFGDSKTISVILMILVLLLLLSTLSIEISKVPDKTAGMAEWAASKTQSRFIFIPQGFGLASDYPSKPNFDAYLYEVYLPTLYFEKENYWGWFGEAAPRPTIDSQILFSCTRAQSFEEITKKISINSKIIFQTMSECTVPVDETFCKVVRNGAIDHVFVNINFPEVRAFAESSKCLEKDGEFEKLVSYKVVGKEPYATGGMVYYKNSNKINLFLPASPERELSIKESYYPGWKAQLGDKEILILPDESNFIKLKLPALNSSQELKMAYYPEKLFGVPLFFSMVSWAGVLAFLLFPKLFDKYLPKLQRIAD